MFIHAALLAAALAPAYHGNGMQSHRVLATMPPYPTGRADSVHRPGFNGKLWISRPMIGGTADNTLLGWPDPGPGAYGASETDGSVVYAYVNRHILGFSPWVMQSSVELGRAGQQLEHARNVWLAEQGYTGGVRTFVNDAYMPREELVHADAAPSRSLEPAAIMERPIDMPRFRTRMEVMALPKGATLADCRISWPAGTRESTVIRQYTASESRVASK